MQNFMSLNWRLDAGLIRVQGRLLVWVRVTALGTLEVSFNMSESRL